ncbi:M28 family metallopeptidase [Streptomyces sp. NE06-03E]|uniref:M20/M25/M40 family metallo-hydrolase n=2 Tax=Streptomyces TaxID=1883 RepID=A0A652KI75_9ACTN|nr:MULTISPECIES: M28 family metallopeptidase [unclassified Streptomyces]MDX3058885.1 M28 family metallopeptidase [Streptomyces sp. NE06-03E]MDX3328276.1 M28 family metallopeptidase [Streptomyces sp. ME02-6979-3A]TXS23351.1 M20/M25/M40 family metallo-hydrolase [Streptomyces sp. gb1(2016)]
MRAPRRRATAVAAAAALAAPLLLAAGPTDDADDLARRLVDRASAEDAYRHLERFQALADEAGGHRAAGSAGYDASAAYVHRLLRKAGYRVGYQEFDFVYTETLAEKLSVVSPTARDITIRAMTYTASTEEGGITAALATVPADATTGCEASDYAADGFTGKIALIERGGCSFAEKQAAAAKAGAVGAVIYNNTEGALSGTLGDAGSGKIPTGGVTRAEGEKLVAEVAKGEVKVSLELREFREERVTRNVVAETPGGNAAKTVMLGAHLDSVTDGPGINDNASGSAGLLEVALELAGSHRTPANKVRFAWWSAEENGLLGSEAYVAQLSEAQREQIALYLNFDMIASPNGAQFVFDGDDSDKAGAGPGPEGSAQLERDINAFLDSRGKPHTGTDFSGRSDYGPFIEAGIPAGGTDTGAEGIKTAAQAETYGGTAGVAYDPCYHAACDDLDNIGLGHFETNIDVIAHAVGTYAHDLGSLARPVPSASATGEARGGGGSRTGQGHGVTE